MNQEDVESFLERAEESLQSAEIDFAGRRYNSCANRCYYACFQAAVAALGAAGIGPPGPRGKWGHDSVQASFAGQLIKQRKLYSGQLKNVLPAMQRLRNQADYEPEPVKQKAAGRSLRQCSEFVQAVRQGVLR